MELNEFRIRCKRKTGFSIIPLGDIHLGTKACDEKALKETIDHIAQNPNCYWVGMGDYADFINLADPRFDSKVLAPWLSTKDLDNLAAIQASKVAEYLEPIKKKCLGLLCGNHEETIRRRYSYHVAEHICNSLGVKYLTWAALIRIVAIDDAVQGGHDAIRLYAEHGTGGGRYTGAKLNAIQMDGKFIDAEIYCRGHVHEKVASINPCLSITTRGNPAWVETSRVFVLTGSFLRTYHFDPETPYSTYAERMSYPATAIGSPEIHIRFDPYRVTVKT